MFEEATLVAEILEMENSPGGGYCDFLRLTVIEQTELEIVRCCRETNLIVWVCDPPLQHLSFSNPHLLIDLHPPGIGEPFSLPSKLEAILLQHTDGGEVILGHPGG